MEKFVKIEIGSRGFIEDLDLIETTYDRIEEYYDNHIQYLLDVEDEGDVEEMENYIEEFCSCDVYWERGFARLRISEEDEIIYINYRKHQQICDRLLKLAQSGDWVDEIYDIISKF